ncbi:DMT family transporter [Massilia sp. W12]|uniref:DMT family transporter n=1 Tax=Massilia sp. W12 TaxID=3126507 RepID=UPI0030D38DDA
MSKHMRGIFALLFVTLAWGTTFPAMKDLTTSMTPVWIIFSRFFLAALLLIPFLRGLQWRDVKIGLLMGGMLFLCFILQVEGLARISSNRNAFITGLNVLIVPLLGILLGALPNRRIMLAVAMAMLGLYLLCWEDAAWSFGDTLTLLCALAYAVYIKMMEIYSRKVASLMRFTATQIWVVMLSALLYLLIVEAPTLAVEKHIDSLNYFQHQWAVILQNWPNLLYLGAFCTAAVISVQSWGQQNTSANEAAVIYAFEPAAAAIVGFFWLGETMSQAAIAGALLMIAGMIVSQWQRTQAKTLLTPD